MLISENIVQLKQNVSIHLHGAFNFGLKEHYIYKDFHLILFLVIDLMQLTFQTVRVCILQRFPVSSFTIHGNMLIFTGPWDMLNTGVTIRMSRATISLMKTLLMTM